jgi:hypothetical protein
VQTRVLIADLDRIVQILNGDIAAKEEQTGIFDLFHSEYPMLARALAARRDNLTDTIAALEQRLATIKEPKFELPSARISRYRRNAIAWCCNRTAIFTEFTEPRKPDACGSVTGHAAPMGLIQEDWTGIRVGPTPTP